MAARGIRFALESSFVNGGIDVVFSGHEHLYNRSELQKGVLYFISGGAGSLRQGDVGPSAAIAKGYDADFTIVDLKRRETITAKWLRSKCGWSPFEGRRFRSQVAATFVNGQKVWDGRQIIGVPAGQRLRYARD